MTMENEKPTVKQAFLKFSLGAESLVRFMGGAAALLLLVLLVLMMAELLSRNFLGKSLHISWEIGSYCMAGCVFLGAGAAMQHGEHVRVTVIHGFLSAFGLRILDGFVSLFGLSFSILLTAVMTNYAWRSFADGVMSWSGFGIPLFVPQLFMAVGAFTFSLQLLSRVIRVCLNMPTEFVESQAQ